MPHVVFDKKIDLEYFYEHFQEIMFTKPFLIKLLDVYIDKQKRSLLIPALTIDKLHQEFFVEISTRKNKTTVKLYSGTDPEKTDGVKMSLGLTAKIIQDMNPNYNITKTNITEFLFNDKQDLLVTKNNN